MPENVLSGHVSGQFTPERIDTSRFEWEELEENSKADFSIVVYMVKGIPAYAEYTFEMHGRKSS